MTAGLSMALFSVSQIAAMIYFHSNYGRQLEPVNL
jgi:hypothetical protein